MQARQLDFDNQRTHLTWPRDIPVNAQRREFLVLVLNCCILSIIIEAEPSEHYQQLDINMTFEIGLTLSIILMALVLFATEKLRVDLIALMILLFLAITGLVDRGEVFLGFSNPAVITIWAVYIVSGGLFKTGVADMLGSFILRLSGASEARLIAIIMLVCGIISAFINNVGAVAVLMPAVIGISNKTKIPASKLLIPLAFSSLLGGSMTLIGTPANILAQGILVSRGLPNFGFFDITPMGIIALLTGILYMVLIGRHLLPVRETFSDLKVSTQFRA